MRELIPKDDFGIFADNHDTAMVDSLYVADVFKREHKNVLKAIENLDCSEEFYRLNFKPITYKDSKGRKQKAVAMTRDGFMFLAMGFNGKKAAIIKELYIKRFNEMENIIRDLVSARHDFPELTDAVRLAHEKPMPYHYSNECDMLNRLVLGMSAKQFRETHGIEKGKSIRPYMSADQIKLIDKLQKVDVGLLLAIPDYEERKKHLERYIEQTSVKAVEVA